MKALSFCEALIKGLLVGFIVTSPIYIFKDGCQKNDINYNASDNINLNPVEDVHENIVATYGPLGLVQNVYQNNKLVSKNCFSCYNKREFICNNCFGSGRGEYLPKTVLVHSYVKRNGTRVRSHYRSSPGTRSRCYTCNGSGKIKCRNCQ